MTTKTLTDLPVAEIPVNADIIHLRQGFIDKKMTLEQLAQFVVDESDMEETIFRRNGIVTERYDVDNIDNVNINNIKHSGFYEGSNLAGTLPTGLNTASAFLVHFQRPHGSIVSARQVLYFEGDGSNTGIVWTRSQFNGDWAGWTRQLLGSDIVNDLTSAETGKPLSANMGKYIKDEHIDRTVGVHGASSGKTANLIIIRDSNARARIEQPSHNDDIANKLYTDTAISTGITTHNNVTNPHSSTNLPIANRLVLRDGNGRARFGAPSNGSDAAILNTFNFATVGSEVTAITRSGITNSETLTFQINEPEISGTNILLADCHFYIANTGSPAILALWITQTGGTDSGGSTWSKIVTNPLGGSANRYIQLPAGRYRIAILTTTGGTWGGSFGMEYFVKYKWKNALRSY